MGTDSEKPEFRYAPTTTESRACRAWGAELEFARVDLHSYRRPRRSYLSKLEPYWLLSFAHKIADQARAAHIAESLQALILLMGTPLLAIADVSVLEIPSPAINDTGVIALSTLVETCLSDDEP